MLSTEREIKVLEVRASEGSASGKEAQEVLWEEVIVLRLERSKSKPLDYLPRAFRARGNRQCKGPEADGDWLVLRNSKEAGVTKSRVSKRGWCVKGLFGHRGMWLLS